MQKAGITLFLWTTLALATPDPCVQILKILTPKAPKYLLSIKAYIQAQKDITGKSTYRAPTHAGIRLDIPLYDAREKWELKRKYLLALKDAKELLKEYLSVRSKVEEMKKYLSWQWKRVEAGIEYRRDIWQQEIQYKQEKGHLKAITAVLMSAGINKSLLDSCYQTLKGGNRP